jgi:methionine-rich copper-binding protein CopC
MTTRRFLLALGACTVLGAAGGAATASAPSARHNRLVKAEPAVEGTVSAAPKQIRLWFKEAPEAKVSGITLLSVRGTDSTAVPLGPVHGTDAATSIAADLPKPIGSGRYAVRWRTAGKDGHVIRGQFGFTLQ